MFFRARQAAATLAGRAGRTSTTSTRAGSMAARSVASGPDDGSDHGEASSVIILTMRPAAGSVS